jgi:formylglycine-generating enzyme required for sulfatase activity
MGSPEHEARRKPEEAPQYRVIDRTLAVGTTEVTVAQFQAFRKEYKPDPAFAADGRCPATAIVWYDAIAYCNWLSKLAGIAKSQWCYPERIVQGLCIEPGALDRAGFRLPTEAEWEYFCRAGTITSRPFGESEKLMSRYAWTWLNSGDKSQPVAQLLPNEFGLFDVLGNNWEWCHDGQRETEGILYPPYPLGTTETPSPDDDYGRCCIKAGTWRFLRGGAFDYSPVMARSAQRYAVYVLLDNPYLGFRVVRTIPPGDEK